MSYGSTDDHDGDTTQTPTTPLRHASHVPTSTPRGVRNVKDEGHASVKSSVINLTNTIIGAGALAFPSAFASMGLIPGILSCVFSGGIMIFGLYLLSRCATVVGTRPGDEGRKASFNEVARLTFSKGWAIRLFDLAIAIKCFGVSVSYLIICKTLLPKVCLTLSESINHTLPADSLLLSQDFWLIVSMIVVIPLSFLKTLDALRFTSQIALTTVIYLILVVVGWFIVKGPSPTRGPVQLARFGQNTLANFPVQVFAFTCAQNLFPIYNELENKTQKRMNAVIVSSIGSGIVCYEILGIFGYLTFGSKVGSNVIAMYPATSLVIAIGRLGIVLLVGLSYPLQLMPCRNCIHTLTRGLVNKIKDRSGQGQNQSVQSQGQGQGQGRAGSVSGRFLAEQRGYASPARSMAEEDEGDPLMPKSYETPGSIKRGGDMTTKKFIFLTTAILIAGFFVALSVDELEVVLGFVGSTGSTILSFILPGFFYFNLFRQEKGPLKWAALALGIYGLAVMFFCLTFNIIALERRKSPAGA